MSVPGLAINKSTYADAPHRSRVPGSDLRLERLFEDRAHFTPSATAVLTESESLTYRDLDRQANRLARRLVREGLRPGMRAAICVSRSAGMIVAVLAVLKCGATWVPLDPRYPVERLRFIVGDADCRFLLKERGMTNCPELGEGSVVHPDDGATEAERDTPPRVDGASELAYLIYTSGTTGRPKGVMINHANVVAYVRSMRQRLGVLPCDNWLHTASLAFSSSIRQIFLPLYAGASITIAAERHIADPLLLLELMRERRVTIIDLVPTYWRLCVDALEKASAEERRHLLDNGVRMVLSASEALWSEVARRWAALGHPAELINMFGQTETAGIVCTHRITAEDLLHTRIVPVGDAIPGVNVRLLDDAHQEVAPGQPGVLHIEGPTVGAGYWKLPDQTRERFVRYAGATRVMYCTGDLVRRGADGELEFLGRGDDQIKIRGNRVEVAEIEAALRSCPEVSDAAVTHERAESTGDVVLTAWIVLRAGVADAAGVRVRLARTLPDYMVPARVAVVAELPLTPNGKIDRRQLAANRGPAHPGCGALTAPRDIVEEALFGLWSEFLHARNFGVTDDFLTVGGNSVLATQLMSRVREVFRVRLPVEAFFRERTISGVARALKQLESTPGNTEKIAAIVARVQNMSAAEAANILSRNREREKHHEA